MTNGPDTRYRVRGGNALHGTVFVQGAKNAALTLMPWWQHRAAPVSRPEEIGKS